MLEKWIPIQGHTNWVSQRGSEGIASQSSTKPLTTQPDILVLSNFYQKRGLKWQTRLRRTRDARLLPSLREVNWAFHINKSDESFFFPSIKTDDSLARRLTAAMTSICLLVQAWHPDFTHISPFTGGKKKKERESARMRMLYKAWWTLQ